MKLNFLYQITAASRTPDQGATAHRSPFSLSSTEYVEPPPNKIPGYATHILWAPPRSSILPYQRRWVMLVPGCRLFTVCRLFITHTEQRGKNAVCLCVLKQTVRLVITGQDFGLMVICHDVSEECAVFIGNKLPVNNASYPRRSLSSSTKPQITQCGKYNNYCSLNRQHMHTQWREVNISCNAAFMWRWGRALNTGPCQATSFCFVIHCLH